MKTCPCGLPDYSLCCGVYHRGEQLPQTPEALMRSRYAAYALADIDYIKKTMKGKPLIGFNDIEAKVWTSSVKWLRLKVIQSQNESPHIGYVEFIAKYIEAGQHRSIHELSEFHRIDGEWFYVGGEYPEGNK